MNVKTIIFPSSYFSDIRPDEALQDEYAAAAETGLFETVLFSNDKWFSDEKLVIFFSESGTPFYIAAVSKFPPHKYPSTKAAGEFQ